MANSSKTVNDPLARMIEIRKSFGRVEVLKGVNLDIYPGEVHILAGENGAGKSTLINILAGVHTEYEGTIELGGRPVRFNSPLDANARGISVIHQEMSLIPSMNVTDNIFLGRNLTKAGIVRDVSQAKQAEGLLKQFGVHINPNQLVEQFPISIQQLIEIVKALSQDARIIVMDEPTSALSAPEVEKLFGLIEDLKSHDCGIIYITHKMDEITRIADRITVLRDGQFINSAPASEVPVPKLLQWMVGREMDQQFPRHESHPAEEKLKTEGFSVFPDGFSAKPAVDDVSLSVRSGEIVGIGGLQGSGASELMLGLFGAYGKRTSGSVLLDGKPVRITSPGMAIDKGVALLTNDRKATGLIMSMSIISNVSLADLGNLSSTGWRRPVKERAVTEAQTEALNLRAASLNMDVAELSGGNQQKVAIGKWLQTGPSLLLLDEPTRGIDIGAKHEIYQLMNDWAGQGMAIMMITSEMPELLAMSDRILVMHRGKVMAELGREEATADLVLEAAMGRNMLDGCAV